MSKNYHDEKELKKESWCRPCVHCASSLKTFFFWISRKRNTGEGEFQKRNFLKEIRHFLVPERRHITIRAWLSHVISITGEASTKKFCIDVCTSSLQNKIINK
jgi:hypothetical protein